MRGINAMRTLLAVLSASLLLLCSCDDSLGKVCDRYALIELAVVNLHCSDAGYLTDNGYADYNDCFDVESRAVALSIISCKGRDGVIP